MTHETSELIKDVHGDGHFRPSYIPEFTTPEQFVDAKVKILRNHLGINITYEDIAYLRQFKTEVQINNAVKTIINKYWE